MFREVSIVLLSHGIGATFPSHYTYSDKKPVSHRLWTAKEYICSCTRGMIGGREFKYRWEPKAKSAEPTTSPTCQHRASGSLQHTYLSLLTRKNCYLCCWQKKLGWPHIVGEVIAQALVEM